LAIIKDKHMEAIEKDDNAEGSKQKGSPTNMNILICTVPTNAVGAKLLRKRSEGPIPITPKLAIGYLVSWMERNGYHDYKFYDIDMLYPDDEEIKEYLKRNMPDVVGLSAVVSTSYQQVQRIARIIRNVNQKAYIVVGGYLTSAANLLLRKTNVDLCVVGDGEVTWIDVLNHLKNNNVVDNKALETIQGLAFINDSGELVFTGYGKQINQNDLPFIDYELLKTGLDGSLDKIENYFRDAKYSSLFSFDKRISDNTRGDKLAWLFLSKGCVAKCTFCQRYTQGYRVFDYAKLDAHLEMLKKNYNVGCILVGDENFGANRKHSYEVAKVFKKHNMLWAAAGVRCKNVNREDVMFYKNHNCSYLKFGVESGSQKILDIMEKRFDVDDIEQAISYCNDSGLLSPLAYMFGMPGENEKTIMESGQMTGRLAASLRIPALLYMDAGEGDAYALPLMGTPLYEWGRELGLIGLNLDEEEQSINLLAGLGAYKRYYINISGAPMSEVVFWDWLAKLEASRTCRKLMRGEAWDTDLMDKFQERTVIIENNPHTKGAKKLVPFQYVSDIVRKFLIGNKIIDTLPRKVIYPVIKYMLFLEYLIQRFVYRENYPIYSNNLFKSKDRITDKEYHLAELNGMKSLRGILENRKSQRGCIAFNKRGQVKKRVYYNEEAGDLLRQGL
jgi:radical SAM superfamily enzyme YgiQ (UPF0313 family)|tara:strand:+ start:5941 stop:7953 length:2013 start_codon:yes stop_codon:yes gene_type:complete